MSKIDFSKPEEVAKVYAGNFLKFDSFAYFGDIPIEDRARWTIIYTHNRDSDLLAESNAKAYADLMKPFIARRQAREFEASHWAVGWVAGFEILVYTKKGKVTKAFKAYCALKAEEEVMFTLNEDDYAERVDDATWKNVQFQVRYIGRSWNTPAPEEPVKFTEFARDVYSWLAENEPEELENLDDMGGSPSDEAIERALLALGYKKED